MEPVTERSELATRAKEPGFWRDLWQQVRLVMALLRDPEVPFYLKLLPFTAVLYLLFPLDLLTDVVPVLGQLDDLTALLIGSKVFVELAPPAVVARHLQAIRERDGFASPASSEATGVSDKELNESIVIDGQHEVLPPKDQA